MSVFEKMNAAMDAKDVDAFLDCFHEDYEFVRHQSGTVMDRAGFGAMIHKMMDSPALKFENHRCLYENGEVLVEHSVMSFPDGSKEAVLEFHTLKDGKIRRTETGATPLSA
jgi:ketosteroid isomerase-like protein